MDTPLEDPEAVWIVPPFKKQAIEKLFFVQVFLRNFCFFKGSIFMPGNGFEVSNSFLEEFDLSFHEYLYQKGSELINACRQINVHGGTQYIRFQDVGGDAEFVESIGDITKYSPIEYDARRLKPQAIEKALILDKFIQVQQGTPDASMLAKQLSNACGRTIDKIIVNGIDGPVFTESEGRKLLSGAEKVTGYVGTDTPMGVVAAYDKTQTIAWNDATACGELEKNTLMTNAGLSASKVAKAVCKLRDKNNMVGPFICITNARGKLSLRTDKSVASSDFNDIHAFANGVNNPYAGVDAFVETNQVRSGKSKVDANGKYNANGLAVKYAWVYSLPQIVLGCSMPLQMVSNSNPERHMNPVIMYQGMYDCIRMYEESVVRIEILEDLSSIAGKDPKTIFAC